VSGEMLLLLFTLLSLLTHVSSDHYATLGVSKNADRKAIVTAYRTLAKETHPDKAHATFWRALTITVGLIHELM
jgi:DnaJ-domain-containing protein 1